KLDAMQHVLVLNLHHIVADEWSMRPLLRDLSAAYAARVQGSPPSWSPLPLQYPDFALGQQELHEGALEEQAEFWKTVLNDMPEELSLPTDRPRPAVSSYQGGLVRLEVDAELHARLRVLARKCDVTLYMV